MKNNIKELRTKEFDVLRSELLQKKRELGVKVLKFKLKTEKDNSVFKKLRKEIARMNHVLNEKSTLSNIAK